MVYGLTVSDLKTLGLYMSQHVDGKYYAEPGLFVINADQKLQIVGIGNAASCRPDLDVILDGINGIQTRNLPIARTATGD
ncbi:MAG: hypothetical protein ACTSX7_12760 [Alphaproteobacteria bacterium]